MSLNRKYWDWRYWDLRYLSIPYWWWRFQRFLDRPKIGYKCRVHGIGPVVTVKYVEYGSDVVLSDGSREDWYQCCERVH